MIKRSVLVILLSIMSNLVLAQTQAEMNEMAMNDYNESDIQLNKHYKQLVNMLDKESKQKLIEAQRLWIKYRDLHCNFEASYFEGGTIKPLIKFTCLKTITDQRIDNFKQSINMRDN